MAAPASMLWRVRDGVTVEAKGWERVDVSFRGRHAVLREISPGMRAALERMMAGAVLEPSLSDLVVVEGTGSLAEWYCHLDLLQRLTAIEWVAADSAGVLATLTGMTGAFRPSFEPLDPATRYVLSCFAFLRAVGGAWILESPLSGARVTLAGRGVPAVASFAVARTPAELRGAASAGESVEALALLLRGAGLLQPVDTEGRAIGDVEANAQGWDFADALFHFRSRSGRSDGHFGARSGAAPPVLRASTRPTDQAERISLPVPSAHSGGSTRFESVLERRRSVRRYGSRPIDSAQLAEFLYRAAGALPGEPTRRSYPSGGSCYPLELYLVSNQCEGLPRGIYRYEPVTHALDRIHSPVEVLEALINRYQPSAAVDPIQVLFLVTLRFGRIAERYEKIAYALALKEVGALFQTMYLVGTALGLAPCAIGMGDNIAVAEALGRDPLEEASVGEFLLGSRDSGA